MRTSPRTRRLVIGGLLAATAALVPVQTAAVRLLHGEPYPALFQPSFGDVLASPDQVVSQQTTLTVISTTGKRYRLDTRDLLPTVRVLPAVVLRRIYWDGPAEDVATLEAWTAARVEAALPHVQADRLDIVWTDVSRSTADGAVEDRRVVHHTVVPIEAAS